MLNLGTKHTVMLDKMKVVVEQQSGKMTEIVDIYGTHETKESKRKKKMRLSFFSLKHPMWAVWRNKWCDARRRPQAIAGEGKMYPVMVVLHVSIELIC